MNFNWLKVRLGDISNGLGSYGIGASAVPYSSDLYTYLRITDIYDDGTLNKADLKSVNDVNSRKYILKQNDIVFARTGASTGRNYFYEPKDGQFVYAGFLITFSLDPQKINPKYIKYYCQSDEYKGWIKFFDTGSTRGNINAKTLAEMPLTLPPRKQQNLLVNTLSGLDDKIKLNNRINANLEAQAQAIFKSRFVDFEPFQDGEFVKSELGMIPKGWRVGTLGDMGTITMGQSPDGNSYNETGEGCVFYQGRTDFGWRYPTIRLFTTEPKGLAKKGDILLSVRAPVGDLNIAKKDCCIGRGLAAISCKNQSFIFYTMLSLKNQFDMFNGEGTVFGCINKDDLHEMKIIIPPENTCSPLDNNIFTNCQQNITLAAIRDILLPKLMSGEIEVKNARNMEAC